MRKRDTGIANTARYTSTKPVYTIDKTVEAAKAVKTSRGAPRSNTTRIRLFAFGQLQQGT